MRYMGPGPFDRKTTEADFKRYLTHWEEHGFGLWAAEEKATGALVGRVGLAYHRVWPDDPEIGWFIDTPWQKRGLATEAGAACLRYGFGELGFARIVSICTPENAPSRAVMAKLGLRRLRELDDPELGIRLWIHAAERTGSPFAPAGLSLVL